METGQIISHYKITGQLGRGGMGVVYRAEDTRLGRPVALKFIPEEFAENDQALERFRREARAAAALNHPHICTVYDVGEWEGRPYLALELLDGRPLNDVIASEAIEFDRFVEMGLQIADALNAAHSAGVIHRDIKPGNIFVTSGGSIKVLDFGLAKLAPRHGADTATTVNDHLTNPGSTVGTVAYMSPEQARGKEVDRRTDLFSTGVVLYEMATGKQAFPGETSAVVFEGILTKEPLAPTHLKVGLPPDLDRVVAKALEKDPDLRYQTAGDLRSDLKRLRRDSLSGMSVPVKTAVLVPQQLISPDAVKRLADRAPDMIRRFANTAFDVSVADPYQGGKRPGLAFLLGMIPGVGALYNAQFPKAGAHFVIFALLLALQDVGASTIETFFGFLTFGFYAYMPFEAYHTAKQRRLLREQTKPSEPTGD